MQLNLDIPFELPKNAYEYGNRSSGEVHGVVLTKPHVVELILDLAGYTSDKNLADVRLLEPSCGKGAFLIPAAKRLLAAAARERRDLSSLERCLVAFDIDKGHVEETRSELVKLLEGHGAGRTEAVRVAAAWVNEGDFLLAYLAVPFDFVVGNPPYIRYEQLSEALHAEYRRRYTSLYDRADLYVAFIERGLSLLSPDGVLSFICADRWISNRYGAPLRAFIAERYQLRCYIDLHHASPFESEVIAYPSIFVMQPGKADAVPVVTLATCSAAECEAVPALITGRKKRAPGVTVARYKRWFEGDEPWVLGSPRQLETLRVLEAKYPPIESTARVGIGVATGNDRIYVVDSEADIERDRLVPLVMRDDIERGEIKDAGHFVINTFDALGRVVDLKAYPKLRRYFDSHADEIKTRHVAQKNERSWFRTIDRVYPELVKKPKLLIPDIAGSNEVAFDEGRFHPHHNLYFVTSEHWDMEVLGGLLSSRVALFFVWSYAVKMRGGYLRFQAQYLRRIRLPDRQTLPAGLGKKIRAAFRARDFMKLDEAAQAAYGLDELPPFDFVDTRS